MVRRSVFVAERYPFGYALAAFLVALVGAVASLIHVSDTIASYVPPSARVQFGATGHANWWWALKTLAQQMWSCNTACDPARQAALNNAYLALAIPAVVTALVTIIVCVLGSNVQERAFRRKPPQPKKDAPLTLHVGRSTGTLSQRGHRSSMLPNIDVALTGDDVCQNTVIFGGIGGGKTTSSLNRFVHELLRLASKCGMLIFDVKGDYGNTLRALAKMAGREVTLIGVGGRPCNLLQDLSPELAASFLKSVLVLAGSGVGTSSIYLNTATDYAKNLLGVLSYTERYSLSALSELVFNFRLIKPLVDEVEDALERKGDAVALARFLGYKYYLQKVFPAMADNIKQSVGSTLSQVLDGFSLPEIQAAFCTPGADSLTMNEVLDGRVLLMDLPISVYGYTARTAYTMVKLRFFNVVNQRRSNREWNQTRPLVFVCDEYQEVVSVAKGVDSDLNFWDKSRSAKCAGIISAQGYSSFDAAIGDDTLTEAMLQNFRQKICFRTEDERTIKKFAFLLGKAMMITRIKSRSFSRSSMGASRGTTEQDRAAAEDTIDAALFREMQRGKALCVLSIAGKSFDDVLDMPYLEPPGVSVESDLPNMGQQKTSGRVPVALTEMVEQT